MRIEIPVPFNFPFGTKIHGMRASYLDGKPVTLADVTLPKPIIFTSKAKP